MNIEARQRLLQQIKAQFKIHYMPTHNELFGLLLDLGLDFLEENAKFFALVTKEPLQQICFLPRSKILPVETIYMISQFLKQAEYPLIVYWPEQVNENGDCRLSRLKWVREGQHIDFTLEVLYPSASADTFEMEIAGQLRSLLRDYRISLKEPFSFEYTQATEPYSAEFVRFRVPGDGNCFFYALEHQLKRIGYPRTYNHSELRALAVEHMRQHIQDYQDIVACEDIQHELVEQYFERMKKDKEYAGEPEIKALAKALGVCIQVMQPNDATPLVYPNGGHPTIYLAYNGRFKGQAGHYDSLMPTAELKPNLPTENNTNERISIRSQRPTRLSNEGINGDDPYWVALRALSVITHESQEYYDKCDRWLQRYNVRFGFLDYVDLILETIPTINTHLYELEQLLDIAQMPLLIEPLKSRADFLRHTEQLMLDERMDTWRQVFTLRRIGRLLALAMLCYQRNTLALSCIPFLISLQVINRFLLSLVNPGLKKQLLGYVLHLLQSGILNAYMLYKRLPSDSIYAEVIKPRYVVDWSNMMLQGALTLILQIPAILFIVLGLQFMVTKSLGKDLFPEGSQRYLDNQTGFIALAVLLLQKVLENREPYLPKLLKHWSDRQAAEETQLMGFAKSCQNICEWEVTSSLAERCLQQAFYTTQRVSFQAKTELYKDTKQITECELSITHQNTTCIYYRLSCGTFVPTYKQNLAKDKDLAIIPTKTSSNYTWSHCPQ